VPTGNPLERKVNGQPCCGAAQLEVQSIGRTLNVLLGVYQPN
jgi:hypothetical protein